MFLAHDSVALLPPWEGEVSGFFAREPLAVRRAMRAASGWQEPLGTEPLAITLWRLIDDPAVREVLRAGGDLAVDVEASADVLRPTSLQLRLPFPSRRDDAGGDAEDRMGSYRNEFYLKGQGAVVPSSLSETGCRVAAASYSDFVDAARPAALSLMESTGPEQNRPWPFPETDSGPEAPRPADLLFTRFLPYHMEMLDDAAAAFLIQRLPTGPLKHHLNLVLNVLIRDFWQPPSRQSHPETDANFWRTTVLVAGGLLDRELMGSPRGPADRLAGHGDTRAARISNEDRWRVVLPPVPGDERRRQRAVLLTAHLMPAGTEIALQRQLVLDDPLSQLDYTLLG
jgi:hypothetical protein